MAEIMKWIVALIGIITVVSPGHAQIQPPCYPDCEASTHSLYLPTIARDPAAFFERPVFLWLEWIGVDREWQEPPVFIAYVLVTTEAGDVIRAERGERYRGTEFDIFWPCDWVDDVGMMAIIDFESGNTGQDNQRSKIWIAFTYDPPEGNPPPCYPEGVWK